MRSSPFLEITPYTLARIAESNQSDTVKVFNLLKSLSQKVEKDLNTEPYLLSIGERAEAIAQTFKLRQISTQEALKLLEELVREINDAAHEQAERGISGEPFAILWLLKKEGAPVVKAETVAGEMAEVLDQFPHWRTSDRQAREVRRELYKRLQNADIRNVPDIAERIMAVVKRERL